MTSERDMEAAREMFEKLRSNMPYSEKLEYIAAALAKVRGEERAESAERIAACEELLAETSKTIRALSKEEPQK